MCRGRSLRNSCWRRRHSGRKRRRSRQGWGGLLWWRSRVRVRVSLHTRGDNGRVGLVDGRGRRSLLVCGVGGNVIGRIGHMSGLVVMTHLVRRKLRVGIGIDVAVRVYQAPMLVVLVILVMLVVLMVGWEDRVRRRLRPTSASIQAWDWSWSSNAARHGLPSRQMISVHRAGLGVE